MDSPACFGIMYSNPVDFGVKCGRDCCVDDTARVLAGSVVGDRLTIGRNSTIGECSIIGNFMTVGCGSVIGANATVGNKVKIGKKVKIVLIEP